MLVITRKKGETVYIGEGISVTVIDLGHGRVKLGVDAPREVPVRRSEPGEGFFEQQQREVR